MRVKERAKRLVPFRAVRYFDGEPYYHTSSWYLKSDADQSARQLRSIGNKVRIIRKPGSRVFRYQIWTRHKGFTVKPK